MSPYGTGRRAVGAAAYDWPGRVLAPATGSVGTGLSEMDIRVPLSVVTSALVFSRVTTLSRKISRAGTLMGSVWVVQSMETSFAETSPSAILPCKSPWITLRQSAWILTICLWTAPIPSEVTFA